MDIESARCACCGLKEDCTQEYIDNVKGNFGGKWLCGLCSEAVRDELSKDRNSQDGIEEAIKAHKEFCRMPLSSPAVRVADGMKQMLRRRSGDKMRPATPSKARQL
ncbi:hypothetical protein SEVIR_3G189100v4 [Setaria viridis]|uniref:DUF1677 family protein n=2 Tax=Setaria TaxID=4554 RepID=K3ZDI5_SETIT|nr:uncharacterized protein LOC111256734 [Setaria italica]XP_034586554.1 uncharacterized protein LOC117849061 [Setaria viridis]RCV17009.1 hypothetical protein SETIT_3G184400v2 [Setaria italica]TKW26436.1 hypothetical protein SEVIR_3G189100v2 [Setaria viridis]